MALPVQSVRAEPEHRPLLQAIADLLRQGKADDVRRLIEDASQRSVGPFRSEEAAIGFLRDRLVARLHPSMIWLFGSRARGDARPHSDFDLLVVLPDGLPDRAYTYDAVAEPVYASGIGCDVLPCSWSDFVGYRDDDGSLIHRVVTEGRLLYESSELRRAKRRRT